MVASLLVEFLLHTIGWVVPLRLLFDASMRFAQGEQYPVGLRRIFLGGTLVLLAMLFSILYLTVFLAPSIELHLISHGTILVGFLLALSGARTALAALRPTPDREQPTRPIARRPFLALPAFLVLLVLAEGLASRAEPLWLLDRVLYALNLSLLAALYMSFGLWTKRETGTVASTMLSVVAAACALLAIVAHSLMIMDVSPPLKAAAQVGRGALLALGALAIYTAYRLWLARSVRLQSADSVLLKPKLQLQQRLALFISIGTVLFAVGGVIMSDITRSSIQTVEQTYIQDQERVARAVARNFESLTNDLVAALSRFAAQPAVQRIRTDSLRLLFSREYPRWQQVVSFFSRVDERGILRYTYPEIASSIGADLTTQQHVQEFLRTRQITLSGVFRAVQGFNAMALYVPVFRQTSSHDSVFAGGVALLVHTDAFSARAFRNVQVLNPNPVAAINLAGSVIASSESELVGISAQQYLESVFPVPIPDDTAAHVVRRALELTTPGVLPLGVGEALTARRWVIAYPIHLDGTRVGSILLSIRQADVVSLYRSSIAQQVVWWMVITALLMLTMGSIAVVVYRWAVYLEAEVRRTVALVREREERLQTIIDTEPECVKILDAEGRVLEMNRAGLQMIEAEALTAVQGKRVYPLLVPEYRERFQQMTRNVFEERSGTLEFEIVGLRGTRRWLDTHMVPLRDAAGRVVAALGITRDITERKRLEEQRRRDQEIQSLLHKILRYSLEAPSLQEGLTQVLNLILSAPFLKLFHRGGIFLTDETQRRLVLTAQVNLPPALQSICAFVPFGRCLCGRAAETGQIQTASCVDERHENVYPGLVPHGHFNVPLVSEGKVLGVMVLYVEHGHRFEALEFSFLRAAADVVAGIIKRGQANELLRRQFNELLAVHSMISTLNSARSLDEINAAALRTLVDGLRADRASILLFDHNGVMRFVAWSGLSDAYRAAVEGHSPWSADAQSAEPILIEDVAVDPSVAAVRSHVLGEGIRSLAFIPLLHGGRLLGKLMLYFNTPHSFSDEEVRVAKAVATHIAAAVARHHAEERRRAIERIVDNSQVVLFRWRLEPGWPVAFVSEQVRQFGYTPDDFVSGRIDYASIVHPDDRVRVRDEARSYISTNTDRFRQEYRILTRDGKVRWVDDRSLVVRDNAGKINYVEGTILDITEQKQAQQALEASEEELRTLFAAMDDLVLVIDQEGVYRKIAPTHHDLLYRPAAELVGRRLHDVFPRKQADLFLGAIHQCLQSQQRTLLEYELAIGERKVPFLASVSPFSHDATLWIIRDITGLKKAQAEVEMLALAVKSLDECVSITDVDDRIIFVNAPFERTYGYRREELLGKHLGVIRSPLNAPEHVAQILPATLAGGWRGELMNRRKDGTDFPISLTTAAVRDAEGNVVALIGVAQDITERKRAEKLLRESEERFRNIFEKHRSVMLLIDPATGAIVDANQAAAEFYGYPRSTLRTMKIQDINQLNPEEVAALRQRAVKEEQNYFIFPHRLANGDVRTVEVHTSPIELQDRTVLFSIIHDITERKRAEETLRESELRFRSVWENATDGMRITNEEGTIVMVNEAFCRMVEKSREELEGQPLSVVYEPTRQHDVLRKHQERFRSRTIPPYLERDLTLWNGKKMSFALSNTFLELPGRPPLSLSIFRDITERKRAETLRLRLSQVLESIASDEGLPQILERLVRAIEEFVPEMKGSVLLLDADGERLRHGSAPSLPDDYNRAIDGLRIGPRVGSCGTAAYEKRLVIVEDIQTDPLWADYHDLAAKHGLRACWSQPIIDHEGAVLGTLALYYQQPRKPTEAELDLINTAANIAGIAIKRKRAEEALRTSEAKYRSLFENVLEGIYQSTPGGRLLTANPALVRMLGYESEEELKGVDIGRDLYVNPGDRETFTQQLEKKGIVQNLELTLKRKDGTHIALLENAHVVRNEEGAVLYYEGTLTDITERKRAEEEILQSHERYERFFREDLTGDYISTPDGRLLACNPAFLRIFGFSSEQEALNTNVIILFRTPEERQRLLSRLQRERKLEYYEMRMRKRDGTPLSIIANIIGRFNEHDRLVEMQGYLFDDTKRQQLEEQLRHTQKLESIGTLAGGIAHDFNNILGIIMGHASLLEQLHDDRQKLAKRAETILKATERGASLVKQLLTFARKAETVLEPFDVNLLIREMGKMLRETFPRDIELQLHLEKDLPAIIVDANQLHQVVLNLCVNARDAMPNGGTLTIATSRVEAEVLSHRFPNIAAREYLALTISDTGVGIDPQIRDRIFEPFFTTKAPGHGTGLGLAVVHGIVGSHGGYIEVESELNKGTTFRVYLPVAPEVMAGTESRSRADEAIPGGTETILIVEDEGDLRQVLELVLTSAGYKVVACADGEQALRLYSSRAVEIALVIADRGLPVLSGDEVFRRVRAINPQAKVILASGFIEPDLKSELLKAGVQDFIQKPYTLNEVLRKTRSVLDVKS